MIKPLSLSAIGSAVSERCKMLKRTITGTCYVAIIVAFFLLRQYVNPKLFNILTYFFIVAGTFELSRMLSAYAIKGILIVSMTYAILFGIAYALTEYLLLPGYGWLVALDLTAVAVIALSVYSLIKNENGKTFLISLLPFVYPSLLLLTTLLANDMGFNGFIAVLLIFVVAPCADTMAYLVGSAIGGKKLCPKLSPKKTWSGAIGGVIGGGLGGFLLWLICRPQLNFFSPVLFMIVTGLIAAVLTEIGDLFESYIKRRSGVKDSGKILPGHGGVLDRIDGMMFASVFIYFIFLFV